MPLPMVGHTMKWSENKDDVLYIHQHLQEEWNTLKSDNT